MNISDSLSGCQCHVSSIFKHLLRSLQNKENKSKPQYVKTSKWCYAIAVKFFQINIILHISCQKFVLNPFDKTYCKFSPPFWLVTSETVSDQKNCNETIVADYFTKMTHPNKALSIESSSSSLP